MRRMLWTTVVALAVAQGAEAFDFVRDGRCAVRFAGVADGAERAFATNEFFRVVRAVTGAEPMADAPNEIAFRVDPSLGPSDTYEIRVEKAAAGERLWLAGNSDVSCWFAMVDLLEQLGCRWFWPGADGEYLPDATRNLSLDIVPRRSTAAFPNRAFSFHLTRSRDAREKHAFTRHQRLHPVLKWGGHSFNWVLPADCRTPDEYFDKYPEQYALWKGVRSPKQHCYTNPDTIRTFVGWLVRLCDAHPEVDRFTLSPKDVPIHCQCAGCAASDPSTTYFAFINTVVAEVVKARPGRKFSTIAYSFYLNVPKVRIHPAIAVDYCMYNRCYMHPFGAADCPLNPKALAAMVDWKAVLSGAPGIYGYHFDIWGASQPMIAPQERVLLDEIRWARGFGVENWYTEWYASGAETLCHRFPAYVLARALWNPDLDFGALKADWCARIYGAAAREMADVLTALEDAWSGSQHVGGYGASPEVFADGFVSKELVARLDGLFAAAEAKLAAAADPRAAREVAREKAWWGRWRSLKLARDDWASLAAQPDATRLAYLLDEAKPSRPLYPWPENPQGNWTERLASEDPTLAAAHLKSDGLLWGNHPRVFRGGPWINYEQSMDFRFDPAERKKAFTLRLRVGTTRFREKFDRLDLSFDRQAYSAAVFVRHGQPVRPLVARTKFAAPLADGWHRLAVRLADTKMRVTLDGTVLYTVDVPLGGGAMNICTYAAKFDVKNVCVRALDAPTQAELAAFAARRAGKKAVVDGTGRTVYE